MALEDAKGQIDLAFTRADLKGAAFENTFGGATSFLRRKYTKDLKGVDLCVTGVPFDQAVTNRPGTRFGPRAIREASSLWRHSQSPITVIWRLIMRMWPRRPPRLRLISRAFWHKGQAR